MSFKTVAKRPLKTGSLTQREPLFFKEKVEMTDQDYKNAPYRLAFELRKNAKKKPDAKTAVKPEKK